MKTFAALLAVWFAVALCQCATVTNLFKTPSGGLLSGRVLITPDPYAKLVDGYLVTTPALTNTVTNGVFSQVLEAGGYRITPPSTRDIRINVPDSTGTVAMASIIVSGTATLYEIPVGIPTGGTAGQIILKSSSTNYAVAWGDAPTELPAPGTDGQVLTLASGLPVWADSAVVDAIDTNNVPALTVGVLSATAVNVGGTGVVSALAGKQPLNSTLTRLAGIGAGSAGDMLLRDATGWTNIAKGTNGQVLQIASGSPAWRTGAYPPGGALGDILRKASSSDYDAQWLSFDDAGLVATFQQDLTYAQKLVARQNIGAGAFFDASGFPSIPGNTNIVFTGPFLTPTNGVKFGMEAAVPPHVQIAFINTGDYARIWNDTRVREVELFVPAELPVTAELYIDFWRIQSGDRCDYVGTSGNIRSLVTANDTVQRVTLPKTVDVRMGDVTGGHVVYDGSSWGAAFHLVTGGGDSDVRYAYSVTLRDGTPWFDAGVAVVTDNTVPISVYGDAPVFCMVGDSRIDGYPYSNSLSKGAKVLGGHWWDADADPSYLFAKITGLSVRNEGRAGYDTGEMEARIADVLASKAAWYVFCTGFYNDIYASRTKAQFLNSSTNIINALLASGARVVVVPDFPFKDMAYPPDFDTDIQNLTSDEWMGDLEAIVLSYYAADQVLWADARNYMGQERPDTGSTYWRQYNRWDLVPLFYYGEPVSGLPDCYDLLHWSKAGEEACARSIVSEIRDPLRILYSRGVNATVDVLVSGGSTNRLVFSNGILVTNIVSFSE